MIWYRDMTSWYHIVIWYHDMISWCDVLISYHDVISCCHITISYHDLASWSDIWLANRGGTPARGGAPGTNFGGSWKLGKTARTPTAKSCLGKNAWTSNTCKTVVIAHPGLFLGPDSEKTCWSPKPPFWSPKPRGRRGCRQKHRSPGHPVLVCRDQISRSGRSLTPIKGTAHGSRIEDRNFKNSLRAS